MSMSTVEPTSQLRLFGEGLLAGILGIVATIFVAAGLVSVVPQPLVNIATLGAILAVATPLGVAFGLRYRRQWIVPTLLAGGLLGGVLFLRGQVFVFQGRAISYPLLFGLPGTAVAIGGPVLGAALSSQSSLARHETGATVPPPVRVGLLVAVGWTGIELLFGAGVGGAVGAAVSNQFAGVLIATILGFPVAALVAVRLGRRVEIGRSEWDYHSGRRPVGVGLLVGILTVLLIQGIGLVLATGGWSDTATATFGFVLEDLQAGLWIVLLFAAAHGIVAPITEELAWRGVVQTSLVRAEGPLVGIVATAGLFTAKHALLDASLARVPTVLVLALVLGVVRHRWGTTASTLVHGIVNMVSVVLLALSTGSV